MKPPFVYQEENGSYSIGVGEWIGSGWKTRYLRLDSGFASRSEAEEELKKYQWALSKGWHKNDN